MLKSRLIKKISCSTLTSLILEHCGGDSMVVHGEEFILTSLPVFVCSKDDEVYGFCIFKENEKYIEIIALNALTPGKGIGSVLIGEVIRYAKANGKFQIKLTTTNENVGAITFYKKMGFELYAVDAGAVTRARLIKPSIPLFSDQGILIKDELNFSFSCGNE
ncbi:GNAT family N-acetyltransferase [Rahnella sp. C60]|uniref:GNAT family N-acetyltransferase n=2 Tax=Rahnella perminowiae TaxID=2816244 RepID=UPI001C270B1A|nr:GNAT family N-acetyltransferase [Rahnella perminowiae]MBU9813494.1 GNAT family N-acetyltransferase [Rahnella perminowiae]MCX2944379.1 GNAT family N-acetyltransferase [Rahnella perminowiae]